MKPKKIKYIIFDLVGVLFQINKFKTMRDIGLWRTTKYFATYWSNPVDGFLRMLDALAHLEGITANTIKYKQHYQPTCIADCSRGLLSTIEVGNIIKKGMEQLDAQKFFKSLLEKEVMHKICNLFFTTGKLAANARPNKKLIQLIKNLLAQGNHKIFLLTNIDTDGFENLTTKHKNIFSVFDGIVASCDVQLIKPEPEIYKHILSTYDLNPSACIFIDDQAENVAAAHNEGIAGIQYKTVTQVQKQFAELGIL